MHLSDLEKSDPLPKARHRRKRHGEPSMLQHFDRIAQVDLEIPVDRKFSQGLG